MRLFTICSTSLLMILGNVPLGSADELHPPRKFQVEDVPNDTGETLKLSWKISPDEESGDDGEVIGYELQRSSIQANGNRSEFEIIKTFVAGIVSYNDQGLDPEIDYEYRLRTLGKNASTSGFVKFGPVSPQMSYFDWDKLYFGILMLIVCGSVVYFIAQARSGKVLKIRKVAGLEAVEEAVGRATEMGRNVLFIPGIQDINEIQTVAGLIVLNRVAEYTAEYDAGLDVPTTRSLVMTTARETVSSAYTAAGRPDLYNPDNIYYVTDEQFGFVAAVTGKMVREKPAACFYMGAFYAESLIFAETANTVGAIQIAGTAMPSQLPFFVAACDYVLIGEEFFAASAYLSGEPQQLGSLKGQDFGKLIGGALILVGAVIATLAQLELGDAAFLKNSSEFITNKLLGS